MRRRALIAPGRRAEPVSLLDVAPTLLELAASRPGPLLEPHDGPHSVVGEYLAEGVTSPAVMIRQGPYKFISCEGDPDCMTSSTIRTSS